MTRAVVGYVVGFATIELGVASVIALLYPGHLLAIAVGGVGAAVVLLLGILGALWITNPDQAREVGYDVDR